MYSNALTALAIIAMVKVMQSKRFVKAIQNSEHVPDNLISSLKETMLTCQQMSPALEIPPALQAQASFFVNNNKQQQQQKK